MRRSTQKTKTMKPGERAKQLHYVPDYDLTVEASDSIEAGEIAKKQVAKVAKETNQTKEEQ